MKTNMKGSIQICMLLWNLTFVATYAQGETRTWTSSDGRTLEAQWVSANQIEVVLKNKAGRNFTVPLAKLSESDRKWIAAKLAGGAKTKSAGTYSKIWGKEGASWNAEDGTLIDFSFAGYHQGKNDFPDWETGANVKDFGAVGDGIADDTESFRKAMSACPENRVVYIPNGTYKLMDWLGVEGMVDTWVKPKAKSNFAFRGESRDKTVILLAVGLQEIHPWEQKTAHDRPTNQWSWHGGFFWFQESSNVGIENLTIKGGGEQYDSHWKEKGYNGIYFRKVKDAWVRKVNFINVEGGVFVEESQQVTLQDIVFDSTPGYPSVSTFEDNKGMSGHHAILFKEGSSWCVADHVVFRNQFHHELGLNKGVNHCVYSNIKGPNLHFDFHTSNDDINNCLFTEIDAGKGELIWRNNFHGACTGTVLWNISGEKLSFPEENSATRHPVLIEEMKPLVVGWQGRVPREQKVGRPWFENIPPDKVDPPNIYHAQRRKRLGLE